MKDIGRKLFSRAIQAVDPARLVQDILRKKGNHLIVDSRSYDLSSFTRIQVVGMGKASIPMARGIEHVLADRITDGLIVTHHRESLTYLPVIEAAHPLPDERSLEAGRKIRALCAQADATTLVIVLISGGGSALCEDSALSLTSLITVTRQLLGSGASIQEHNIVRQGLSLIKGGKLMQDICPAQSISLVLSDVVGDDLSSIASGPTTAPHTHFGNAQKILKKYHLWDGLDPLVKECLQMQQEKLSPQLFHASQVQVIGTTHTAVKEVAESARELGYAPLVLSSTFTGEARVLGEMWAALAESVRTHGLPHQAPVCLIGGGESTVVVRGQGKGGRNQELALAFLRSCLYRGLSSGLCFLSASTDGRDGPTDAAGCVIEMGDYGYDDLDAIEQALADNDSYHFFQKKSHALYITGPTGTNVCDLQILLSANH